MSFHAQVSVGLLRSATLFNLTLDELTQRIVTPWERGEPIVAGGQVFSFEQSVAVEIYEGAELSAEQIGPGGVGWLLVMQQACRVTDDFLRSVPGARTSDKVGGAADRRLVGVVHGRNVEANRSLFAFLHALDLRPLEWNKLVSRSGLGTPYTGLVVDQLFAAAQAVVVFFTPDDVAYLRDELRGPADAESAASPATQPRPNVLFEAGMSFGLHPERTVVVELGAIRPISDLAGRHVVRLDGTAGPLRSLAQRLKDAGCAVDDTDDHWLDPQNFGGLRPH
jgi:predicted nucleotide-binding protein